MVCGNLGFLSFCLVFSMVSLGCSPGPIGLFGLFWFSDGSALLDGLGPGDQPASQLASQPRRRPTSQPVSQDMLV